jgi:hypothetical protein
MIGDSSVVTSALNAAYTYTPHITPASDTPTATAVAKARTQTYHLHPRGHGWCRVNADGSGVGSVGTTHSHGPHHSVSETVHWGCDKCEK